MQAELAERWYKCRRCGHHSLQKTNHKNIPTWSHDRFGTCPKCPPFAKYPEYGGMTAWDYVGEYDEYTPPNDE
jgi:hypothetical protein